MSSPQHDFAKVADQLQAIAAQMRSLSVASVQPQAQATNRFYNELRDVKNRLRDIETQIKTSSTESIAELGTRVFNLEKTAEQIGESISQVKDTVMNVQEHVVQIELDVTVWKAYKHNVDAKAYNRSIPASYHLRALRHPKTNTPIDQFPLTLDQIKIMPDTHVVHVLNIFGDLSDLYRPAYELRGRLAAIVQGRTTYVD